MKSIFVKEPVLTYYSFFDKNLTNDAEGLYNQSILTKFITNYVEKFELDQSYNDKVNFNPDKINYSLINDKNSIFEVIFGAFSESQYLTNQLLAYIYGDILGILISASLKAPSISIDEAWKGLFNDFISFLSPLNYHASEAPDDEKLARQSGEIVRNDTIILWALLDHFEILNSIKSSDIKSFLPYAIEGELSEMQIYRGKLWFHNTDSRRKIIIILADSTQNDIINHIIWNITNISPPPFNLLEAYSGKLDESANNYYQHRDKIFNRSRSADQLLNWFQNKFAEEDLFLTSNRIEYFNEIIKNLNKGLEIYVDWKRILSIIRELLNTIEFIIVNFDNCILDINSSFNTLDTKMSTDIENLYNSVSNFKMNLKKQIRGDLVYYDALSERLDTVLKVVQAKIEILNRQQDQKQNRLLQFNTAILGSLLAAIAVIQAFSPALHVSNDFIISLCAFVFSLFLALPLLTGNFWTGYKSFDYFAGGLMSSTFSIFILTMIFNLFPVYREILILILPFWCIIVLLGIISCILGIVIIRLIKLLHNKFYFNKH